MKTAFLYHMPVQAPSRHSPQRCMLALPPRSVGRQPASRSEPPPCKHRHLHTYCLVRRPHGLRPSTVAIDHAASPVSSHRICRLLWPGQGGELSDEEAVSCLA